MSTRKKWSISCEQGRVNGETVYRTRIVGPEDITIATIADWIDDPFSDTRENAQLLASAPELLDALKWIRDECVGLPAVARALADKAISKAEHVHGPDCFVREDE